MCHRHACLLSIEGIMLHISGEAWNSPRQVLYKSNNNTGNSRKAVRSKLGYICDIYGLTNNVNGNHVLEFFSLILGNGLALVL